jgi:hypothetical protein
MSLIRISYHEVSVTWLCFQLHDFVVRFGLSGFRDMFLASERLNLSSHHCEPRIHILGTIQYQEKASCVPPIISTPEGES